MNLLDLRADNFPGMAGERGPPDHKRKGPPPRYAEGFFPRMPNRPPPNGPPPGIPESDRGLWTLMVKHHAGSLEAVVGAARRRSLGISFAILLLLGAGMVMIVVSTQRAQRLAKMQMEFVAGVSHELRTPLTVICSAAENLADGLVASKPQVQQYGSVIRNEGSRLREMIEQILGFAGAQSGRMKYDFQPVEPDQIIDRALTSCGSAIRESGCEVVKQIEPDLPPVIADATLLAQCVQNLLSNAVKYGCDGGPILLRAQTVVRDKRPELQISVEDKGQGIDSVDLPHIFEPFYRGQKVIAAQIHGAGIGLSLVKGIIEAHGGKVDVTSTPGQGACFTLHVPSEITPLEQVSKPLERLTEPRA